MNCNFEEDDKYSKSKNKYFDEYYQSKDFKELLQKMRLRGTVEIESIDREDNPLFQKETYLDAIIQLKSGTSLKIDEKANRYKPYYESKPEWVDNFWVEVVSNPSGKTDGTGYHIGTTIVNAKFNKEDNGFLTKPVVYTITNDFVNNVTRNNNFNLIAAPTTNNLYTSRGRWVSRTILEAYFP